MKTATRRLVQKQAAFRCEYCRIHEEDEPYAFHIEHTRQDHVLPILPPGTLPPRKHVPLEQLSNYSVRLVGLKAGDYEIQCEGKTLGTASAEALAKGVNINTLVLDSGTPPPWDALAKQIWAGKDLDQIGKTKWSWRIVRK